MNNLWKIHSVGGFYQNIVSIFDDVRYSLNEAFIISKPKCLSMCAPGCFFYQSVCQVSDSADKIYILLCCVSTDFCMKNFSSITKFSHITKDCNPTSDCHIKDIDGSFHRDWIGIVAIV